MPTPPVPKGHPLYEKLIPIQVFPNQGDGYGHGVTRAGMDGPPEGYDHTSNMDVRQGQYISPSYALSFRDAEYYAGVTPTNPPSFLIPWETAAGVPFVLFALYSAAWKFQDQAIAAETDDTANIYGSACFHDNGAGGQYLYAGTYETTAGVATALTRRTRAGTWATDADVLAKHIVSAAGALWRSTNNYQVSKCPAGSEPYTIANWGSAIQVGTDEARITCMAAILGAPIVFKEDGVWVYNEGDTRFENVYRVARHPNHFPSWQPDGEGGLYTTTAEGDIVHITQFRSIETIRVLDGKFPGRDTPKGRIVDIAAHGAELYALMQPSSDFVQPSGLVVQKTLNDGGAFTDYTTEATDGSLATEVNLDSLATLALGDSLYIGFTQPFLAVQFKITDTNQITSTMAAHISTGAGTWAAVSGLVDMTARYEEPTAANVTLDQNVMGIVALPLAFAGSWATADYGAYTTKYWLRLSFSATLSASTRIGEVGIIPKRVGPFSTPGSDTGDQLVWEASGSLNKVLRGRRVGGRLIWDDVYTLPAVGTTTLRTIGTPGANKISVSQMPTSVSPDLSLVIATRDEFVQLPLPSVAEPSLTPYPELAASGGASPEPAFYPSAIDLGDGLYRLRYLHCIGANFSASDTWRAAFRWGDTNAWSPLLAVAQQNALYEVTDENFGSVLSLAVQIRDIASTDPIGPHGRHIWAWVTREDRHPSDVSDPARATLEIA